MTDFDETNRGKIWPNDKKGNEKWPDFQGFLNVEGVEYWVSGWKRKEGAHPKAPSLSFSIQKKEEKPETHSNQTGGVATETAPAGGGFDDIPFSPIRY